MNKYKALIITIASCCCSSTLVGENLIRSLLNKVSKPSNVVTNLPKQDIGGGLYYYKINTTSSTDPGLTALLRRNKELRARKESAEKVVPTTPLHPGHTPMTPDEIETARIAIAAQKQNQHPDNTPVKSVIDKHPQTEEPVKQAVRNTKRIMYGDGSPLQDTEVVEAWDHYHEAQKRLEEHRAYMEEVRKSRKDVEQQARVTTNVGE